MSAISEKAGALIEQIQEHMIVIETCEAVIGTITDSATEIVALSTFDDDSCISTLDDVLKSNQLEEIKRLILCMINENKANSENFLQAITGTKTEPAEEEDTKPKKTAKKATKSVKE